MSATEDAAQWASEQPEEKEQQWKDTKVRILPKSYMEKSLQKRITDSVGDLYNLPFAKLN
jgi:hypothetical protein